MDCSTEKGMDLPKFARTANRKTECPSRVVAPQLPPFHSTSHCYILFGLTQPGCLHVSRITPNALRAWVPLPAEWGVFETGTRTLESRGVFLLRSYTCDIDSWVLCPLRMCLPSWLPCLPEMLFLRINRENIWKKHIYNHSDYLIQIVFKCSQSWFTPFCDWADQTFPTQGAAQFLSRCLNPV